MKDGEKEEESQNAYLASMLKVAVATAIIKTKPKQLTGEEYARQLSDRFSISQLSWKNKYESVEAELLHAKQELAMREIQNDSSGLQESQSDAPSLFPTPPPSVEEKTSSQPMLHTSQKDLALHTQFLESVAQLKSIPLISGGGLEISKLTKITILKSVNTIQKTISSPCTRSIPYTCLVHAIQTVAKVCAAQTEIIWEDITEDIVLLLETIAANLCSQDNVEEYDAQDQLCTMFVNLGSVERLQKKGLDILLSRIEEFSRHLRDVAVDRTDLDPVMFENMYFILALTESLLLKIRTNSDLKGAFYQRFSDRLDDALLHFTDHFPLFGQVLWKIGCLFMNQSDNPDIMEDVK